MIFAFTLILLAFKRGLQTLYVLMVTFYIITNITAAQVVTASINFFNLFSFNFLASTAAPLYASLFLASDMITEKYGKKPAYKGIWYGFASQICLLVLSFLINLVESDPSSEVANALKTIFSFTPRLVIGSLIAYVVSQNFDIWFFNLIKKLMKDKLPGSRNNLSTMVSQLIDTFLVFFIAFYGVIDNWIDVMFSTYIIKIIVSFCDTPFFLISKKISIPEDKQIV